MSALSTKGRDLVRAGRRAYQMTDADRARLHSALQARLGDAAMAPGAGASATVAAISRAPWWLIPVVVVGIGVVGGALYIARHPSPEPNKLQEPAVVAEGMDPTPAIEPIEAPAAEQPTNQSPALSTADTRKLGSASNHRLNDKLAAEVALLSVATRDLRAGHPAQALKALDEYHRRFPKGLLSDEQQAARAQALCALGRFDEAKAKLTGLPPDAPLTIRAKQICDAKFAAQ
jgi:hypothetical protein